METTTTTTTTNDDDDDERDERDDYDDRDEDFGRGDSTTTLTFRRRCARDGAATRRCSTTTRRDVPRTFRNVACSRADSGAHGSESVSYALATLAKRFSDFSRSFGFLSCERPENDTVVDEHLSKRKTETETETDRAGEDAQGAI